MNTRFIKTITILALLCVFVLQGIWLNNTYSLLDTELKQKLDGTLLEAAHKEVFIRVSDKNRKRKNGSKVEGVRPDSPMDSVMVYFNEFMIEEIEYYPNFQRQDSLYGSILEEKVGKLDYLIERIDSVGNVIEDINHGLDRNAQNSYHIETVWLRLDGSEFLRVMVSSPFRIILSKMLLLLIATVILAIIIVYCIFLQIKIIARQDKIAEIRQDFTYAMIHDMKTPITTIQTGINALKNNKLNAKPELKEQYMKIISEESSRLLELANKILTIAQSEENKLRLNKQKVDLHEMISNLTDKFKIEARKNISFSIDLNNVQFAYADPEYLKQAISNIIDNSIKYSDEKVDINILCCDENNMLKIKIKDNGFGISLKDQKKIFEKFERVGSAGKTGYPSGFGLGLNYVYRVVNAHGGSIEVNSVKGSYSEFIINLPKHYDY